MPRKKVTTARCLVSGGRVSVTWTVASSPAFTSTVVGDMTEVAAMLFAINPAAENDRSPSLTTTSWVSILKRTSAAVLFEIVKVWVVPCPGLQRTSMMAGEREMEARGASAGAAVEASAGASGGGTV